MDTAVDNAGYRPRQPIKAHRMRAVLSAATLLLAAIGGDLAYSSPIIIAGGELDPAISDADVYIGVPKAASVPDGAACRTAKNYVDYIQAGRYADVVSLFANDAVVLEPSRQRLQGHDSIEKFYLGSIGQMKPAIVAVAYTGDDTDCMVALSVRVEIDGKPRYKLASVDHFTLNTAGKVVRMVAFRR